MFLCFCFYFQQSVPHSRVLLCVYSMRRRLSTPAGCVQLHWECSTAGVAGLWDFAVITESSATAVSENLWSVYFRPDSAHNDSLFMKLSEIWSGVNTECFTLKLTGCFHVVSVSDLLLRWICHVLNCCIVLRHPAKTHTTGMEEMLWCCCILINHLHSL